MIKLENVSYVYMQGGPFEKTALNNINLEIGDGEFIGLIGHTGSESPRLSAFKRIDKCRPEDAFVLPDLI